MWDHNTGRRVTMEPEAAEHLVLLARSRRQPRYELFDESVVSFLDNGQEIALITPPKNGKPVNVFVSGPTTRLLEKKARELHATIERVVYSALMSTVAETTH